MPWVAANRRLRGGLPFRLDDYPYLRELYEDPTPDVVLMKAGQVGATEYGINRALWTATELMANVLFVLPVWTPDASDFSQARLKAAIEDSPPIFEQASGIDNVGLKRIGLGLIYCRGSERRHALKEMPIDLIIVEELDECNQANLPFAYRRLDHSKLRHRALISNPTLPGTGIHAVWLTTDQREWEVRCPGCGREQPLTFERNLLARREVAYWGCEKCGRDLDRLTGRWVAHQPESPLRGYHIPQALSPRVTAQDIFDDWQQSQGDLFKEQAHYNLRRGEPYAAKGQQIDLAHLMSLREPGYRMPDATPKGACSMGVDVGTVLHVRVSQRGEGGRKRAVYIGTVEEFEQLDGLMTRYDVARCVIDALPETRKAREFIVRHKGRVFMAFYTDDPKKEVEWDLDQRTVLLPRTPVCDTMSFRIAQGGLALPENADRLEPRDAHSGLSQYVIHLKTPVRILRKNTRGEEVAVWSDQDKPDHFFHAEIYDEVAFGTLGGAVKASSKWSGAMTEGLDRTSPWKMR